MNDVAARPLIVPAADPAPPKYWRVTVCFGPAATLWAFLFKTEDAANAALGTANNSPKFMLVDDFGQRASFDSPPHAVMVDDMSCSGDAGNLIQLQNARNQARMNDLVLSDTDPQLQKAIKQGRHQALQQQMMHGMPLGPMPRA